MGNKTWLWVLLLSVVAIGLAGTAAFFSVFGLAKLFAGAGVSALILFGSLEFGKLVSVSVVYRFWKKFSIGMRGTFIFMILGVMLITSLGIYGFLRNAYDQTSNQYNILQKETTISEQRKSTIQLEINRYQQDIDSKNNQINTYIGTRVVQENSMAEMRGKGADTNFTSGERWVFRNNANKTQKSVNETNVQITDLRDQNFLSYGEINSLNDSISGIDMKILELESSDISVDIGPFKYLSDLTGLSMDDVVGILIFIIMVVFDPFAVLLIIAANRLSMLDDKEEKIVKVKKKGYIGKLFKKKENQFSEVFHDENGGAYLHDSSVGIDGTSGTDNIETMIGDLTTVVKDHNEITDKEIGKIRDNIDSFKDVKENINDLIKTIKENSDASDRDLESLRHEIESVNDRIDKLSDKDTDNEDIKEALSEFKDGIKEEFNDYVNTLNQKIDKYGDNREVFDMVRCIKDDFNSRLSNVEMAVKKNNISEITIPGRNSHRAAARRPEIKI